MKTLVQIQRESNSETNRVFLGFDKKGMEHLKELLGPPHFRKEGDHIHWMTKEWGDGDLSSEAYFQGCEVVKHLELYYLGDGEDHSA